MSWVRTGQAQQTSDLPHLFTSTNSGLETAEWVSIWKLRILLCCLSVTFLTAEGRLQDVLLLLHECRGKPWVGPWKKTGNTLFGSSIAFLLHIFIHFAFQHLCSLASTQAFLRGMCFFFRLHFILCLSFRTPFHSLICFSIPFSSMHVLNIDGFYDTRTHTRTGWNCSFA